MREKISLFSINYVIHINEITHYFNDQNMSCLTCFDNCKEVFRPINLFKRPFLTCLIVRHGRVGQKKVLINLPSGIVS